jgi:putative tricarboxylic transport membrane protein
MELAILVAGIAYGLIIGLIPAAGATTGLITLFGFMPYFASDPYLGVIFCVAVVASSTTGDSFSGVLLGIPGANSAAATMVDGFPMARNGEASRALSAAITSSTVNGLLFGSLTFLFLPYYTKIVMFMGIPELWALVVLAFVTVGFVSTRKYIRSILAIALGVFVGLIGVDVNNVPRFTGGWRYLEDGVQILPFVAGLFAIPELWEGWIKRKQTVSHKNLQGSTEGILQGIRDTINCWRDSLRGGAVGSFIGLLPGLGGAMADWLAYGATVASNPQEQFGRGNIRGVVGCEGANNAQKAASFIPTVLFGIPGAPFAAILMALFLYIGIDLGSPDTFYDTKLFDSLTYAFLLGTIITAVICYGLAYFAGWVTRVPYVYYFPFIIATIVWATLQYTGGWQDILMLAICSTLGLLCKRFQVSRPALLIGFLLSDRIYSLTYQLATLHTINDIITRPVFLVIMSCVLFLTYWGITKRSRIDYA